MAAADNGQRAGVWLVSVGGAAAPGDLGAALGLNHQRQADALRWLRDEGLAAGPKNRISLTAEGWTRFGAVATVEAGPLLAEALDGWPAPHAAFARLLDCAVIARQRLRAARPSGHPGFVAVGETATGKTSVVRVAAELVGADWSQVARLAPAETFHGLIGRREPAPDGGYRLAASPVCALPVVFVDELDKAERDVLRAVRYLMHGEVRVAVEGDVLDLLAVPVLAANPPRGARDRYAAFPPDMRRRSIMLDTGFAMAERERVEACAARWQGRRAAWLDVDALPVAECLDERGVNVLRYIPRLLTEAGQETHLRTLPLELLTLGRLALLPARTDHAVAALWTAADYLTVVSTVPGLVVDGWQGRFPGPHELAPLGAGELAAALRRAGDEADARAAGARAVRVRVERESDELTRDRRELAERLNLAAASIDGRAMRSAPDDARARAAGVRAALLGLRDDVYQAKTPGRLADLHTGRAGLLLDQAGELRAAVERTRREAAQHRAESARQAETDRREQTAARAQYKALRRQRAALLDQVTAQAKHWERLYARTTTRAVEAPLAVLREGVDGYPLIRYEADERPEGRARRLLDALAGPGGVWIATAAEGVRFAGSPGRCPALEQWGPGTRVVIAPLLAELHRQEDQLRATLGRAARANRPRVELRAATARPALPR